jgi:hypothetical protein
MPCRLAVRYQSTGETRCLDLQESFGKVFIYLQVYTALQTHTTNQHLHIHHGENLRSHIFTKLTCVDKVADWGSEPRLPEQNNGLTCRNGVEKLCAQVPSERLLICKVSLRLQSLPVLTNILASCQLCKIPVIRKRDHIVRGNNRACK